ncbi:insulinase family protein [Natronosporangium hydrolyticum]|uniref:Insulinase family protein n=1 Tax=Natronosporangium hydrolyticum TaxID=2811111 RepID=A0A895YDE5_9ACTN|nr:pitrilysin family protein [Natronosporangium hydrolyticum]QSB13473.1 insulinase family protein [Natronosporangium hydrolyticum]
MTDTSARRPPRRAARTETLTDDPLGGTICRTVLPSGLRILTEAVPATRSVAFGVWVAVGSRDETPRLSGVSHFLEHLLFKGTRRRSALQISAAIEAVGGETNAFTTKEYTCFHARVLDKHLPLAIDVICDLITDSVLAAPDVETERGVILEEIAMHDDEPSEEVHELFTEQLYGETPLGRRIAGTTETIGAMSRRQIQGFYRRRYLAPSIVVAAAGNLSHQQVVRLVRKAVAGTVLDGAASNPAPVRASHPSPPVGQPGTVARHKDTEQAHLLLGRPTMHRSDERRFALGVLNNVLGGGMSSRLFQRIREERGLAYAIYSFTGLLADSGTFGVYAGCAPGKVDEVLDLVRAELAQTARHGITAEELARGKGMLAGSVVLDLEDTGSRMSRLGKGELLYERPLPVDELLARVDGVTRAEVNELAEQLLAGDFSVATIGPH